MNDTDVDWAVYHQVPDGGTTVDELSLQLGLERDVILASLSRLEKSHLVIYNGERVSPLSINDFFIASMLSDATASPGAAAEDDFGVYIENGVIKVRK
ncbi:MAG TPA: hypothetical protein O0X27_01205 [Methanocorpusculum sp.]|nr:hypothetical protein [Methanocorpusculum sp.]